MISFPQVSPPEPCAHLSPPPYAPHAPHIHYKNIQDVKNPPVPKKISKTGYNQDYRNIVKLILHYKLNVTMCKYYDDYFFIIDIYYKH
jgi:hypothetical protein